MFNVSGYNPKGPDLDPEHFLLNRNASPWTEKRFDWTKTLRSRGIHRFIDMILLVCHYFGRFTIYFVSILDLRRVFGIILDIMGYTWVTYGLHLGYI